LLNKRGELIGIYVGDRTAYTGSIRPFSELHYNFGLITEGAFRTALERLAQ
jgi:hypothetical protein